MIIPTLVPAQGFGYDPALAPYPFAPGKARDLLREAGYPDGLALTLIASEDLEIQPTVVSKMLEQIGLRVTLELLDAVAYTQKTDLRRLDRPDERQPWDIALVSRADRLNFPVFQLYHFYALDGSWDWVLEEPALRQLYAQVLGTVDQEHQQALIRFIVSKPP